MRALIADAVALVLLTVYGTEVCPFLDGLGPVGVGTNLAAGLAVAHVAGRWLERRWVDRAAVVDRADRMYWVTLGRYAAAGLVLTAVDTLVLGFPPGSGLKVVVGTLTLGHFLGVDLALAKERASMDELARGGAPLAEVELRRSFVRRMLFFAVGAVVATSLVVLLLLLRDLAILSESGVGTMPDVQRAIVIELLFVGAAMLALTVVTIMGFARNLRRFLDAETRVLEDVSRGELGQTVPVLSDDEFGAIATHTNRMISGLRERRRVREVLGKIVSPDVARHLLDEHGLALGGERRTVTLLFSDVRDFTAWSEGAEPESLVRDLNLYFTEMVRIVHAERGIVDKFIGDGLMAVFGLDGRSDGASAATRAAEAMLAALGAVNAELSRPIAIGIGVHRGEVVAGNIGSPDRLEYTFIGDAVNTAARIESLTRSVGAPLLVSRAVVDALPEADRPRWHTRGAHPLKGKSEPVEVLALQ